MPMSSAATIAGAGSGGSPAAGTGGAAGSYSPGLLYGISSAVGMLGAGTTAYSQSQAISAANHAQQQTFATNQQLAKIQADEALQTGDWQAQQAGKVAAQRMGLKRAATAAGNIQTDTGSSAATQASDAGQTALDQVNIRTNAWRQAWGYQEQGLDYRGQAAVSGAAAKSQSDSTLLTGGLDMLRIGSSDYSLWQRPRLPYGMGGTYG